MKLEATAKTQVWKWKELTEFMYKFFNTSAQFHTHQFTRHDDTDRVEEKWNHKLEIPMMCVSYNTNYRKVSAVARHTSISIFWHHTRRVTVTEFLHTISMPAVLCHDGGQALKCLLLWHHIISKIVTMDTFLNQTRFDLNNATNHI